MCRCVTSTISHRGNRANGNSGDFTVSPFQIWSYLTSPSVPTMHRSSSTSFPLSLPPIQVLLALPPQPLCIQTATHPPSHQSSLIPVPLNTPHNQPSITSTTYHLTPTPPLTASMDAFLVFIDHSSSSSLYSAAR